MVQNVNLECIKNELRNKSQIYVPDRWLEEVSTEQQENLTTLNFSYFYQKWLNTDLSELDYSSVSIPTLLPDYSIPARKHTLNATFQILRVNDISRPTPNDYCESLYLKSKDDEDEGEDGNQAPPSNQPTQNNQRFFKANSKRQLLFELFNGVKLFKAFEYESINQLNFQNCYPGAKLLINGEVECSINVLLLKASNVTALGGLRLELIEDQQPDQNDNQNAANNHQNNVNHNPSNQNNANTNHNPQNQNNANRNPPNNRANQYRQANR